MKSIFLTVIFTLIFSLCAVAQLTLPRESNRQEVTQTVGDTQVSIVYHRPNTKGREVWGKLVPYGETWRTGANDNTTFEVSNDVTINGQALPKGKYGLHTIPNVNEWIVIFNKVNNEWGSFKYDAKQDALRVKVTPMTAPMQETMSLGFGDVTANTTEVMMLWEKLKVSFSVNVGDVNSRVLTSIRTAIDTRKPDDLRPLNQGANFVLNNKLKANYAEAVSWLDKSIAVKEGFGNLNTKARLLAESGKYKEAIAVGEKAVMVGKAATPKVETTEFEKTIAEWKALKK